MKRFFAAMLAAVMMMCVCAFATETETMTMEELIALVQQLQEENAQYREQLGIAEETEEQTDGDAPAEEEGYTELAKGSKGDAVKKLQQRLKDLGYLSGSVDGDYGNGTKSAVSSFQSQNGLPVTGTADVATQELLFSENAERARVYESLEYKGVSRDPDEYEGRYVKFNGKVLQVMESGSRIQFRIATKGNYDNVVYVTMTKPENYSRILEDDKVTVQGAYAGLYSYETVLGAEVTIPLVKAELVTLR